MVTDIIQEWIFKLQGLHGDDYPLAATQKN